MKIPIRCFQQVKLIFWLGITPIPGKSLATIFPFNNCEPSKQSLVISSAPSRSTKSIPAQRCEAARWHKRFRSCTPSSPSFPKLLQLGASSGFTHAGTLHQLDVDSGEDLSTVRDRPAAAQDSSAKMGRDSPPSAGQYHPDPVWASVVPTITTPCSFIQ